MKKNKIGILNFQYSNHNYGAVIQACSLQYAIEYLGYETIHIDYIPTQSIKSKIKKIIKPYILFTGLVKKSKEVEKMKGEWIFEEFRAKWLKRTHKKYSNRNITEVNEIVDVIIVGSDQVWRPAMTEEKELIYYLKFANQSIRRISYAASFGVDSWEVNDETYTNAVAKELKNFEYISVRESSGVNICKNIFNVEATHVLDPTLLVGREYFDRIINRYLTTSSKIVFYKLDMDDEFTNILNFVSKKYNEEIKNIYAESKDDTHYYNSVELWLADIANSKVVITDSFHCICLALIYNKDFIYIPNKARGLERIQSLLSSLGINDRILYSHDDLMYFFDNLTELDYTEINSKLDELRIKSWHFLENSINC